jgi:type II secretory pathway pseudopilin PulG
MITLQRLKMPRPNSGSSRRARARALSLIEVVASTMIVGLMTVAALNGLGATTRSSDTTGNRAVAIGLADELLAEILQAAYQDPSQTPVFGLESGESATLRSGFDDVDDYDGWNYSPPRYRDGTPMPDRDEWRHRVSVRYVVPSNPTQFAGSDQGAKRIQVTVEHRGKVLAEQYALRTNTDEK